MAKGSEIAALIDWTPFGPASSTNHCACGAVYRSNVKFRWVDDKGVQVTQEPCPGCDSHMDVTRSSSDPERMVVG